MLLTQELLNQTLQVVSVSFSLISAYDFVNGLVYQTTHRTITSHLMSGLRLLVPHFDGALQRLEADAAQRNLARIVRQNQEWLENSRLASSFANLQQEMVELREQMDCATTDLDDLNTSVETDLAALAAEADLWVNSRVAARMETGADEALEDLLASDIPDPEPVVSGEGAALEADRLAIISGCTSRADFQAVARRLGVAIRYGRTGNYRYLTIDELRAAIVRAVDGQILVG